ncbi:MAG: DsrE family protein [Leptolyngbya sp. SIO1D8]|nr:DsrE family protein [Leptolyngbya sp. SIO1D8]
MSSKTLSIAIMDAPYESANSTTALRIIHSALNQGHNVKVFAYEGAVSLTIKAQAPHANSIKGTTVEEENHPTTKDWIAALFQLAQAKGITLNWINCGLCVDERGAGDWIGGVQRGGPADFIKAVHESDGVLVIPTR